MYEQKHKEGCAVAQVAGRWLLMADTRVQSRVTSSEIRGGRSGTEAGYLRVLRFSPANHHATFAPYSSITDP
jgi:hypothetical protein